MTFPQSVPLDTDKKSQVHVHLHRFHLGDRERLCWTYVTTGFRRHNRAQRDICLSLLVEDGANEQDYPKTPLRLFRLLSEKIAEGQVLNAGAGTRLGQKGIFGFPCLFYVPAIQYEGLPALDQHLALILVHQAEYEYARQYGITRFISRLGRFCSSFPYPTWNTQVRPNIFEGTQRELSLLASAGHLAADQSHVDIENRHLHFQVARPDATAILERLEQLAPGEMAVINTAFSPRCDASLYWQEGQTDPGAFSSPRGSTGIIGGSFITLGPAETPDLSITEDGFSLCLPPQQWAQLLGALTLEAELDLSIDGRYRLMVSLMDESPDTIARPWFHQAVWRKIPPIRLDPAVTNPPVVQSELPINLSPNVDLSDAVDRDALKAFVAAVTERVSTAMAEEEAQLRFSVDLAITPTSLRAAVSSEAELNPDFVTFMEDLVAAVPPCDVSAAISIRLPFKVNCP